MKPIQGYDAINEAGELKVLEPGIYPLVITDVIDQPNKEYLEVYYDIVQGEFKGYFAAAKGSIGSDISKECRSYKPNALPFFKSFITAIEKSNQGYQWDWDEKKLIGKYVVGVFGLEEYVDKNNEVKVICALQEFRSVPAWKEGKLKVPEMKKFPDSQRPVKAEALQDQSANLPDLEEIDFPF